MRSTALTHILPGSNQHIALPLTVLNTITADGAAAISARVEAGEKVEEAIRAVIRENESVLFSGNGYDAPALQKFAADGRLFNIASSPEAYAHFTAPKNIELFSRLGVFNEKETRARRIVLEQKFVNDLYVYVAVIAACAPSRWFAVSHVGGDAVRRRRACRCITRSLCPP